MQHASRAQSHSSTGDEPAPSGSTDERPRGRRGLDRVRSDPRRGGDVIRYHTWPTIRPQIVASHSWNVVRILVSIWPHAPREAILYAQFHDTPEVGTGDVPYPVKHDNPVLKLEMDRLEDETAADMGLLHHLGGVGDFWKRRIKICDCIEMWEFGMDEVHMGNRFAEPIVERMRGNVMVGIRALEPCESGAVAAYMRQRERMLA